VYRNTTPASPHRRLQYSPPASVALLRLHVGQLAVELVLLNKHQISGGEAYLDCYPMTNLARVSVCAGVAGVVFLYIAVSVYLAY